MLELFGRASQGGVEEAGDDVALLSLKGEIGSQEAVEVTELIRQVVRMGGWRLVLDLSEVSHFDYRGVRPLISVARELRELGGDLKLAGLSRYLHAIFRSAGAHDAFDYLATAEEARAAFGADLLLAS